MTILYKPNFKKVIKTDVSVWSVVLIPATLFLISLVLYLISDRENKGIVEFLIIILLSLGGELLFFMLGFWWYKVICKLFESKVVLEGIINKEPGADMFYYTFTYNFIYNNKKIEHRTALLKNKYTEKMYSKKEITVFFDPKSNRSVIKEAYIAD